MRLPWNHAFLKSPLLLAAGILLCGSFPPLPRSVGAQVVRGHLVDSQTRHPIINGNVALRDSLGAVVARTATDEEGAYELTARAPGTYSLMAVGLGYRSTPTGQIKLVEGEMLSIDIFLSPQPLELEPVLVRAERIRNELQRHGFFSRREEGRGFFLTPAQLLARPPITEAEVIGRAPFVEINRTWTGSTVSMRSFGRACRPRIFVDDMEVSGGHLEDHVVAVDMIALEVYRGHGEIPQELAVGWMNDCGVIMIWTVWSEMRNKKRGGG